MATNITKNVTRGCPLIVNGEGRVLDARLDEEHGGSLHLKWRGLGKAREVKFLLEELMQGTISTSTVAKEMPEKEDTGGKSRRAVPSPGEGSVTYAQMHSLVNITPMDCKQREDLRDILLYIENNEKWMDSGSDLDFIEWCEEQNLPNNWGK